MADLINNPAVLRAALEAIASGMLLGLGVRAMLTFIYTDTHADTDHDRR